MKSPFYFCYNTFMQKVLALDLDGTLLYPYSFRHRVSKKNVKFLQRWYDAGNRIVLVSSRDHKFLRMIGEDIGRPVDIIAGIGSHIEIDGRVIKHVRIDNEALKNTIEFLNKRFHPLAYLLTTTEHPLIIRNNSIGSKILSAFYWFTWLRQGKSREPYMINNKMFDEEVEHGDIMKMMTFFGMGRSKKVITKEINKVIREQCPDIESSWTSIVNEITPAGCDKGAGVDYYSKYLKIKPSEVYVVGDSGNDITMFNLFHENSYVMAKAYPSVKKYAKHVIRRVYKLDKLLLKEETNNAK